MQAWETFLSYLQQELGADTINKWLRPLKIVHFDACNLYLESQDSFQAAWFEEHIRPKLKKQLLNNNHHEIRVHLTISEEEHSQEPSEHENKKDKPSPPPFLPDPLDPTATLEHFVPGAANAVLSKLINELTGFQQETPIALGMFNPLYIHGSPATGKTHLLMAIASCFQKLGKQVIYIRAETFTEHVVRAIRSGAMLEFRKTYRHADLLLLDDIHILARRGATQEELFHTFNTLHTAGKQIIISANCPPQMLQAIEPRLTSRFEWGLAMHLEKLTPLELRTVLEIRSEALDFSISEETQHFLIKQFGSNPRSLLRALDALILRAHMRHTHSSWLLRPSDVQEMLRDLLEEEKTGTLEPTKIIRTVADFYGIKIEDLLGKSQVQEYVQPRQVAMHLCRLELKTPYLRIGEIFHRDHSTVMSSIKQILKKLENQDRELSAALSVIQQKLGI